MKKFITIAALFATLLLSFKAQAQLSIKAGYAGEFVSIDTIAEGKKGTNYFDGYYFGLNWRFNVTERIDLSIGAQYRTLLGEHSEHYYHLPIQGFVHHYTKERQSLIDLPIMLGYAIPLGQKVTLSPFVGPMFSFAVSGSTHEEWSYPYNTQSDEDWYGDNGPRKRFNLYAMAGLTARFGHVNLTGCYRYGLLELSTREAFSIKASGFSVALGYEF